MMNNKTSGSEYSVWMRRLLVMWIVSMPILLNRYMSFVGIFNRVQISDLIFLLVFAGFIFGIAKGMIRLYLPRSFIAAAVLLAVFVVSSIASRNPVHGLSESIVLLYLIATAVVIASLISDTADITLVIDIWTVISAVVALLGLSGIALSHFNIATPFVRYYPGFMDKTYRLISTMQLPNMTYSYLHISFFIAIPVCFTASSSRKRVLYGAALAVIATALFFTFSRGWVALFLGLSVFAYLFRPQSRMTVAISRGMLFIAILIFCAVQLFITYTTDLTFRVKPGYDTSRVVDHVDVAGNKLFKEDYFFDKGRLYNKIDLSVSFLPTVYWYTKRMAVELWLRSPLIGIGPSMFVENCTQMRDLGRFGLPKQFPDLESHSTYFGVLAKEGVFGLSALIIFFWSLVRSSVSALKKSRDRYVSAVIASMIAAFAGFLVFGLDVDILNLRWFWFMIGFSASAIKLAGGFKTESRVK